MAQYGIELTMDFASGRLMENGLLGTAQIVAMHGEGSTLMTTTIAPTKWHTAGDTLMMVHGMMHTRI